MFMKRNKLYSGSLIVAVLALMFSFSSCEDLLTIDSNRYVTVDENDLSSPNDSVFSILGLLKGMQQIGERYILLGEMRGDLLDVTPYTPASIRQLSDFNVDASNKYADPTDYYSIINNCNYFISRTAAADHPLKSENALAHVIRAWTYMQIAQNWGKVFYFSQPLLTVEDTKIVFPSLEMDQLTDSLIADVEPFVNVAYPNYGAVYDFKSSELFLKMNVVLGDLYLWRGRSTDDYEKAASYYAQVIDKKATTDHGIQQPSISWSYDNFLNQNFENSSPFNSWSQFTVAVSGQSTEMMTVIQMASDASKGIINYIPNNYLEFGYSNVISNLWDDQTYTLHYESGTTSVNYSTTGDLRKKGNIIGNITTSDDITLQVLYKLYFSEHILLYRTGLIYLRYAEAINRAGKPHAAFAVMKYGLNNSSLTNTSWIPASETADKKAYMTIFNNELYDNVEGIHARGCGNVKFDDSYNISAFKDDSQDTIQWVENAICDELALETSFEGNRFGDLIRMAIHRDENSFLAKRVAAKHKTDYDRIYNLLSSDRKNWYLPESGK